MTYRSQFYKLGGAALAACLLASPALAHRLPEEKANAQVVLDFYNAMNDADEAGAMKDRIQGIAEKFISPDYVQHAETFANLPGPGNARDKLVRMFKSMPAMKAPPRPKTEAIMAEGDRVMLLTSREATNPSTGKVTVNYIFNMFRIKDGKLIEHWDISAPPPGAGGPPRGMGGPGGMVPPPGMTPPEGMAPPEGMPPLPPQSN